MPMEVSIVTIFVPFNFAVSFSSLNKSMQTLRVLQYFALNSVQLQF